MFVEETTVFTVLYIEARIIKKENVVWDMLANV